MESNTRLVSKWVLLITWCALPIEVSAVYDPLYHCLVILWTELCKIGVNSPKVFSDAGTCMSYDGEVFGDFSCRYLRVVA